MKQQKYELFDTAIYDYQFIQSHLTDMAAKGWRLDRISTLGIWRYRRSEPARVRYEVTYAPSGSAYNSHPTVQEEILADLCAEAGWVKAAALGPLHIYCNENPNATPLETDEPARIRTIEKAMKKSFVREQFLLIGLFLVQLYMQVSNILRWPTRTLTSPLSVSNVLMIAMVVLLFSVNLGAYFVWLRKARQAADEGLPIPTSSFYRKFRFVLWLFIAAWVVILLCSAELWLVAGALGIGLGCLIVTRLTMELCKHLGAPKWVNIAVPFVVCFVLVSGLLTALILTAEHRGLDIHEPPAADAPLTLADLGAAEDAKTEITVLEQTDSFLGSYGRYWLDSDDGEILLRYTLVDVPWRPLYELCLNEQEMDFLRSTNFLTDDQFVGELSTLWDAEYTRHAPEEFQDRWFVCWDGRILVLRSSWPLTGEQIAAAAQVLKPQGSAAGTNAVKALPAE